MDVACGTGNSTVTGSAVCAPSHASRKPACLYWGMPPLPRRLLVLLTATLLTAVCTAPVTRKPATYAETVGALSESGGFFNSNNLISNERSYLHVIPELRRAGLEGGVYLGVGPDQNFTYIAHTRPSIAFIVDIRRDNLLLHLLFRALFQLADNRAEYMSLLFGRPAPKSRDAWKRASLERIIEHIDLGPAPPDAVTALRARVDAAIERLGVPLSKGDFETIDLFHRTFIERGLELQFESAGRPPQRYYPSYRELLLETDREGRRWNYLANEEDFQFVRTLQRKGLIIPVVGDLGGRTAMAAVGQLLEELGAHLSAFYTSNVEYYLASRGVFDQFVTNLANLPRTERSVIIRAVFPSRYGWAPTTPGYISSSTVQRVDELLSGVAAGRIRGYGDLVNGQ